MAISVAFGLLFVTVIILILLPVFLKWINPLHRSWIWISDGRWISSKDAEPSIREKHHAASLESELGVMSNAEDLAEK
jgi:hypothetical protein